MHTVANLLAAKRTWDDSYDRVETVVTIKPEATARKAARLMSDRRVGALVVTDPANRMVGIVTERDVMRRLVAASKPPDSTHVSEIMTRAVLSCTPQSTLDEVRRTMRERRIRHVPVLEDGRPTGMVSIGDLNAAMNQDLKVTVRAMEAYITQG
ncbi:MAG TPA: CBS domain-containing protein [Phycisphaerales bacterium]|nr:CBS domain-containing protein [Phycisphaerales bacterium]